MAEHWVSTAPYGSAYWAARSPMGANLAKMGHWVYEPDNAIQNTINTGVGAGGNNISSTPDPVRQAYNLYKKTRSIMRGAKKIKQGWNSIKQRWVDLPDSFSTPSLADTPGLTTPPDNILTPGNNGLLSDPNTNVLPPNTAPSTSLPSGTYDPSSMGGVSDDIVNQSLPPTGSLGGATTAGTTANNTGSLSGAYAPPTPPDNMLGGNNGVFDVDSHADSFANVNTGGFNPSLAGNVTFQTGQSGLTGAAGAVTLPEGVTQMADGSMVLADGTTIAADGTVSGGNLGSLVHSYGAKTFQQFQKIAPWAAAALGIYDIVKSKPKGSRAMADFGAVVGLANPVIGLMFAVPAILGTIFGKKHKPKFYSGSDLDKLTFRDYSEGDQYLYNDLSSHGFQNDNSNFRYNLKNNRWEKAVFETRDEPSNNESGSDEISYIAGWVPVPLVQNPDDGQLYLQINKYKYLNLEDTYNRLPEDIQSQVMDSLKTNPPDYSQSYWNEPGQTRSIEAPNYNEGGA